MKKLFLLSAFALSLAGSLCAESFVITNAGTLSGTVGTGSSTTATGIVFSGVGGTFSLGSSALTGTLASLDAHLTGVALSNETLVSQFLLNISGTNIYSYVYNATVTSTIIGLTSSAPGTLQITAAAGTTASGAISGINIQSGTLNIPGLDQVPEPGTLALLGGGLVVLALSRRKLLARSL
jgi:hypothetical protein